MIEKSDGALRPDGLVNQFSKRLDLRRHNSILAFVEFLLETIEGEIRLSEERRSESLSNLFLSAVIFYNTCL
jgi:hypothetical protein